MLGCCDAAGAAGFLQYVHLVLGSLIGKHLNTLEPREVRPPHVRVPGRGTLIGFAFTLSIFRSLK